MMDISSLRCGTADASVMTLPSCRAAELLELLELLLKLLGWMLASPVTATQVRRGSIFPLRRAWKLLVGSEWWGG